MVYVPAGSFLMGGAPGGRTVSTPPTAVKAFWIGRTEVTIGQWRAAMGELPPYYQHASGAVYDDTHPVMGVAWVAATAFCKAVGARLPTEAEWEFAARGPQSRTYPGGDGWVRSFCHIDLETSKDVPMGDRSFASLYGNRTLQTAPVASHPRGVSWCGALDMIGNVWEWCSDPYQVPGEPNSRARVIKGGDGDYAYPEPERWCSWWRNHYAEGAIGSYGGGPVGCGLRVALDG
jgi:iron(II)-dependent oxidoreductase